jgi:hypothetical protein
MKAMTFGRGPSGAAMRREAVRTALPREERIVMEIPASMFHAINRLRGEIPRVKWNGDLCGLPASFAQAVTSVLRRPW